MKVAQVAGFARAALAVVILTAAAQACAREPEESVDPVTLRMGVAMPSTTMGFLRTSLTRDYLISSGEDGRPTPRLLESWTESADGLTWRLRLREGVLFHDGSSLTAADVAPAFESLAKSPFVVSRIISAQPVDSRSLDVSLAERSSFFLEDIAAVYAEKAVDGRTYGTGPFVFESGTDTEMVLKAFPRYFRGSPEIGRVEIDTYPDLRNAWSALMRNEIDFLYELTREARDFVETESSVQVSPFLRPYVILLGFNPSRPQFQSSLVRRALNLAVDRDRLVQDALRGQGRPATTHVWPRSWAFDPATAAPAFSPVQAAAMLEQGGLEVQRSEGKMPARLRFKVMCYAPLTRFALALQRQLARLDIDMQIEVPSTGELVERMQTGDFDAFLFEMSAGRTLKWGYLFWHSKGALRGRFGIDYDAADDALDRLRTADGEDAVRARVADFQRVLMEDPPAVFLSFSEVARVSSRRFEIPSDTEDDIFGSLWRWKPVAAEQR